MKHEEKHAVGMWLVVAFLGGFALLYWAVGRFAGGRRPRGPPPSRRAARLGGGLSQPREISSTARRTYTDTIARRHSGSTMMFSSGWHCL